MNFIFRILVAIYATIAALVSGLIMISPFADKQIMEVIIDYIDVSFYRSNRYDVLIFLLGLLFLALNLVILFSGLRVRRANKFYCFKNNDGLVRISANSIENIALSVTRRSNNVREAKAKAKFVKNGVEITLRMVVYPDTQVPSLSEMLQEKIRASVEMMTELHVETVDINVEGVHTSSKTEEG